MFFAAFKNKIAPYSTACRNKMSFIFGVARNFLQRCVLAACLEMYNSCSLPKNVLKIYKMLGVYVGLGVNVSWTSHASIRFHTSTTSIELTYMSAKRRNFSWQSVSDFLLNLCPATIRISCGIECVTQLGSTSHTKQFLCFRRSKQFLWTDNLPEKPTLTKNPGPYTLLQDLLHVHSDFVLRSHKKLEHIVSSFLPEHLSSCRTLEMLHIRFV